MALSVELILALVSALTFFRAGRLESVGAAYDHSYVWALMSVLLSAIVLVLVEAQWFVLFLCQIGLFVGIGVYRALRDST